MAIPSAPRAAPLSRARLTGCANARAIGFLSRLLEIAYLRVVGALESGAGGAALDKGGQNRLLGCELRHDAQHRSDHQVASGEAIALEIGFVAQRVGEAFQAP